MSKRATSGRTIPAPAAVAAPSREDIVAFIAREREGSPERASTIGKREIARAFGIKGSDKVELKRVLRQLEAEGAIERHGRGWTVITTKGQLAYAAPLPTFRRDGSRDYYPSYRYDF